MPIDHQDVAAWASRIRSHFPAHQQDTAEAAAFWIATSIGPKVRDLRPGTSMGTVLEWLKSARHGFKDPDWVIDWIRLYDEGEGRLTELDTARIDEMPSALVGG